jgi:hypothetical protein
MVVLLSEIICFVGAFHRNLPQVTKFGIEVVTSIPLWVTCGRLSREAPTKQMISESKTTIYKKQM